METMKELSLFSGYGGFTLGLKLAGLKVRTVAYVEIEPYCWGIIGARIKDGLLDDAPIFPDIRSFDGTQCRGLVDIITAGFPCQPHSTAGQRRGAEDERNLWPDTLRVIGEVGPRFVLLENVPGLLSNGYAGTVVGQLSELGYRCRWMLVPAAAVGAPHLRWRWWCLAYAADDGCPAWGWTTEQERQHQEMGWREQPGPDGEDRDVAYSKQPRRQGREIHRRNQLEAPLGGAANPPSPSSADVAYAHGESRALRPAEGERPRRPANGGDVAHSSRTGLEKREGQPGDDGEEQQAFVGAGWWAVEPVMGRVAHGVPHRVDRLRALGNGVVPAVVAEFLRRVTG